MIILIQKLQDFSPTDFADMLTESASTNFLAIQRLADEWVSGANRFNCNGEALFVAQQDKYIIGVCGLNIDPYAACEATGRVRRLYVMLERRRQGIGRALVERVVDEARLNFERLHMRTYSNIADRFYCTLGFTRQYGNECCTHKLELRKYF